MDSVLGCSVRSTIRDRAASHVDDPIAALFDPLDVVVETIFTRQALTISFDMYGLPNAAQIGCALGKGFGTCGQDRRREGVAVPTGRGVRHGDVVGKDVIV
jgi:hypothetical protein